MEKSWEYLVFDKDSNTVKAISKDKFIENIKEECVKAGLMKSDKEIMDDAYDLLWEIRDFIEDHGIELNEELAHKFHNVVSKLKRK